MRIHPVGRKPLPENQKNSERIGLLVKPATRKVLEGLSELKGIPMAVLVRQILEASLSTPHFTPTPERLPDTKRD